MDLMPTENYSFLFADQQDEVEPQERYDLQDNSDIDEETECFLYSQIYYENNNQSSEEVCPSVEALPSAEAGPPDIVTFVPLRDGSIPMTSTPVSAVDDVSKAKTKSRLAMLKSEEFKENSITAKDVSDFDSEKPDSNESESEPKKKRKKKKKMKGKVSITEPVLEPKEKKKSKKLKDMSVDVEELKEMLKKKKLKSKKLKEKSDVETDAVQKKKKKIVKDISVITNSVLEEEKQNKVKSQKLKKSDVIEIDSKLKEENKAKSKKLNGKLDETRLVAKLKKFKKDAKTRKQMDQSDLEKFIQPVIVSSEDSNAESRCKVLGSKRKLKNGKVKKSKKSKSSEYVTVLNSDFENDSDLDVIVLDSDTNDMILNPSDECQPIAVSDSDDSSDDDNPYKSSLGVLNGSVIGKESTKNSINTNVMDIQLNLSEDTSMSKPIEEGDDLQDILDSLDDCDWSVDDARPRSFRTPSRYYTGQTGNRPFRSKCKRCNVVHLSEADCKKRPPTCYYCGGKGHIASHCKEFDCTRCKMPGHLVKDCPQSFDMQRIRCDRCCMKGHKAEMCPDIWRQYHATTVESAAPVQPGENFPTPRVACCNCGSTDHMVYDCNSRRHGWDLATYTDVARYDTVQDIEWMRKRVPKQLELLDKDIEPSKGKVNKSSVKGSGNSDDNEIDENLRRLQKKERLAKNKLDAYQKKLQGMTDIRKSEKREERFLRWKHTEAQQKVREAMANTFKEIGLQNSRNRKNHSKKFNITLPVEQNLWDIGQPLADKKPDSRSVSLNSTLPNVKIGNDRISDKSQFKLDSLDVTVPLNKSLPSGKAGNHTPLKEKNTARKRKSQDFESLFMRFSAVRGKHTAEGIWKKKQYKTKKIKKS